MAMANLTAIAAKPLIGISSNVHGESIGATNPYINAVRNAGGVPIVLPCDTCEANIEVMLSNLDGIVLTGGEDVDPRYYGEEAIPEMGTIVAERDVFDLALARLALKRNIPMLGICRGCQVINVAFGGTLYQDIPAQLGIAPDVHKSLTGGPRPKHMATIARDSELYKIFNADTVCINSSHHQSVKDVCEGAKIVAWSADGIIEAFEMYPKRKVLCVQFHPEGYDEETIKMRSIFDFFIGEATLFHNAK